MAWLGVGISAFTEFTQFYIAPTCYNVSIVKPGPQPFQSKICPLCKIEKPRSEYYKKGRGVSHKCKPCSLIYSRARASRYIGKYPEYQNEWRSKRYASDAAYRKKIAAQKKASYEKRVKAINAKRRERWAKDPNNPARLYHRRKDVNGRTPPWVSKKALLEVYSKCPPGMEVDHIIPLKGVIDGRKVSGLHVPWNLQYLTPAENRKKKNIVSEKDI